MSTHEGCEAMPGAPPSGSSNLKKHPCILCQQRKVKCDKNLPCSNCKKALAECISPLTLPARKRKRRFPEAELLARLRKYEYHLRNYGADIDAINSEQRIPTAETPEPPGTISNSPASYLGPGATNTLSGRRSLKKYVENNMWDGQFRDTEELLQGSSEDEMFENPITKTYDSMPSSEEADLVVGYLPPQNLTGLHPMPVSIFRLWQTFLDRVNPLTRIFHASSVQQQVLDATADLESIPKGLEALMFGIYAMAVTSLTDDECEKMFDEKRDRLIKKYQYGARQALTKAGYLRSSDIIILQAFTLYLLSYLQMTVDPRSLFCLNGIAIRIAQRIGLSTDGPTHALLPFEVEMRRRLWSS